jgi:hypothetical protein
MRLTQTALARDCITEAERPVGETFFSGAGQIQSRAAKPD